MDADAVAAGIEKAHEEISILQYNDENSLSCTINLAFYFAREYYTIVREIACGKRICRHMYDSEKRAFG